MREKVRKIVSRSVVLERDDVDTDQIIPARFLKVTAKEGLGKVLFADWRFDAEGRPRPDFVLNRPEAEGARVLVAGRNFGCGSSREHAPWALVDFGFQAVVAASFADIFQNNALKNGLLPVRVDDETHARLLASPGAVVTVDLEAQTVSAPGVPAVAFPTEPFARHCLLEGIDELEFLLGQEAGIQAYEAARGSARSTSASSGVVG
jgi:3-isopropylmalate/(R)-2-methylmalate dehydratase small subunit